MCVLCLTTQGQKPSGDFPNPTPKWAGKRVSVPFSSAGSRPHTLGEVFVSTRALLQPSPRTGSPVLEPRSPALPSDLPSHLSLGNRNPGAPT